MIVHIKGGLGNQLFQLAFAHDLYEKSGIYPKVFLPKAYQSRYDVRELLEGCQHLKEVSRASGFFLEILFRYKIFLKAASQLGLLIFENDEGFVILEGVPSRNKRFLSLLVVSGFWQDWKYAQGSDGLFALELQEYIDTRVEAPTRVAVSGQVVVHIRRGDLLLRHNREIYGIVPLSSYRKILSQLEEIYPKTSIITVTDSPFEVSNEGAGEDFGLLLGPNSCDPWQVLKLMRNANVAISANSTLSWWGAFIAARTGALVYVPKPWYANFSTDSSDKKMYPQFRQYEACYQREGD